jgi:steroid delta-isomerase-like uncharacterized protein
METDAPSMSNHLARDLIKRWEAGVNAHDTAALAALYGEDASLTSPMLKTRTGRVSIAESYDLLFLTFPDWTIKVSNILVGDDQIAALMTASATDRSGTFGLPATGQQFNYRCVVLFTLRAGSIVCEERIYDLLAIVERLEKARTDRELQAASDVQRALFPRDPRLGKHYEAIGHSIPCRAIGGDFFDFFALPSGAFGTILGDVSGKGPAAALLASLIQGIMTADADRWQSPSSALARTNDALIHRGIEGRFATISCVMVTSDGCLTYANAGHNPPLLVTRDGVKRLAAGGPILGVFENAMFPQETVQMNDGDMLIMFTDGVSEALNSDGEEYGERRFMDCVVTLRECSPAESLNRSFLSLLEWCGPTPQYDDMTLVALRYNRPSR